MIFLNKYRIVISIWWEFCVFGHGCIQNLSSRYFTLPCTLPQKYPKI